MRSVFYWEAAGLSLDRGNPYGGLLAHALARLDVELVAGYFADLSESWLLKNQHNVDVLHLNWPYHMYKAADLAEAVSRCTELISHLVHARTLGYKVIWTVHNLYPHDTPHPDLDRLARLAITGLATAIIVHCRHARGLVKQHFHREEGVFEIPHGHFIAPYPNMVTREEARRRLELPENHFVYLAFGGVRPNKGLEHLVQVFSELPGDDLILLMAAHISNEYGTTLVERARQADPRIVIHTSRFFSNEDFQTYFNAADVVVLPFRDILTSGSTITALSFARPVIVPALGCLPELVDSSMGIIYDPNRPDGLKQAMKTIQHYDLPACGHAAYLRAESLSWESIARLTLEAYRH